MGEAHLILYAAAVAVGGGVLYLLYMILLELKQLNRHYRRRSESAPACKSRCAASA